VEHADFFPVGIVGAGPVGLVVAARLASFGIPTVILEADPELRRQGSKACLIQGDVLEILDKFGCAEPINDEGVTWRVARTYVRDREIRAVTHPARIGYGPFVNISQYRIERVLLDRVEAEPLCQVRWSHTVTGVAQDEDGVLVRAQTPDGEREVRVRYLVACDGVRSVVRGLVGAEWSGYTHKDRFLITDIKAELPLAKERHFHYDPSFNPGRQLIIHPQPGDIWRIDWQLAADADVDLERTSGEFDRRVRAVIGDIPYEVDWASTYRFNQRVVTQFKVGRVFFAGDAAHSLPPYGSRGMNSGIQDADNIAWKLASVLNGHSRESLLDSYHPERYAAALENLAAAEATIKFMAPPSLPKRIVRGIILRLSAPLRSMRRHVNSGRMAEPFVYTDSPIVEDPVRHPIMGHFAPDGWVSVQGRRERIRRQYGDGFVGLYFGSDARSALRFIQQARAHDTGLPVKLVLVQPSDVDIEQLADVAVVRPESDQLLADYHAKPDTWLLIRPDGHVSAAGDGAHADHFTAALLRAAVALGAPAGVAG
jgi:2-polyprenyl-6-methoxyphenol hydroxylase-like FAD-dependent oxidoreductase